MSSTLRVQRVPLPFGLRIEKYGVKVELTEMRFTFLRTFAASLEGLLVWMELKRIRSSGIEVRIGAPSSVPTVSAG